MDHADHINLLSDGIEGPGGTWADFGSGGGAFTLALADLLGAGATIYSIDKSGRGLREQERLLTEHYPDRDMHYVEGDFTKPLDLPPLDGAVMANSFHFVKDRQKDAVLRLIHSYLRPGGRLIVVEYNTDRGNFWVPHPFSYPTWERLAARNGFTGTRLLATRSSRHLREIYSAVSIRPDE